ncbi:Protein-export protein SecB (maintains pre-export unfolded state) [hydrothermal vent metagenome]|uniref:Protein-export protein SecB (Maintains pre-export unfolded state) n=1 Tax=hydrothermal vent metagenome TaxID=652676 RepID=A0A3B0ZEV6_9ZZZZ
MTNEISNGTTASEPQEGPRISVIQIYMKDCSFEAPNTPEIFSVTDAQPDFKFSLDSSARQLEDEVFEVLLTVTVTAKIDSKVLCLAEVHQAGIFSFIDFSKQELESALATWCPEQLYPYAREAISSLTSRGGMPISLDHQNFESIYAKNQDSETTH